MRPGEEWGSPTAEPPDVEVSGGDADLARAVAAAPAAVPLVRFRPAETSELARALGLGRGEGNTAVPLDALRVSGGQVAVNGVVVGVPPDRLRAWHHTVPVELTIDGQTTRVRATSVVVMIGQYWRGADLSPRGHPGDGIAEVSVYGLAPGARRAMRTRLAHGAHLPHPDITVRRARRVGLRFERAAPVEVDARPAGRAATLELEVVPGAYRLLV